MMAYVGLLVITLGWLYQLGSISKKKKEITPIFVGGYVLGVFLLIVDGLQNNLTALAGLNGLTLLAAAGTWWKLNKLK